MLRRDDLLIHLGLLQPRIAFIDELKSRAESARPTETPKPIRKRQDSMNDPASDPWASPAKNIPPSTAAHTMKPAGDDSTVDALNGVATTASTFTANGQGSSPEGQSAWGVYSGEGSFAETSTLHGGFGEPAEPSNPAQRTLNTPLKVPRGTGEYVTITTLPDKEGIFLFQHHNYEVKAVRRGSSVVRRYSDFVWLLDCLHKRYPFRRLPLLPPKRVQGM